MGARRDTDLKLIRKEQEMTGVYGYASFVIDALGILEINIHKEKRYAFMLVDNLLLDNAVLMEGIFLIITEDQILIPLEVTQENYKKMHEIYLPTNDQHLTLSSLKYMKGRVILIGEKNMAKIKNKKDLFEMSEEKIEDMVNHYYQWTRMNIFEGEIRLTYAAVKSFLN
jgi:hypothetical protein